MKKTFLWIIGLCFFLAGVGEASAQQQGEVSTSIYGQWRSSEYVQGHSKPYSSFVLKLHKTGSGGLKGSYCFITQEGNRIDCDSDDSQENLEGTVDASGSHATVHFYSFFGAKNGVAELSIHDGKLHWDVVKAPTGDFFYGPDKAALTKEDAESVRRRTVSVPRAFLYEDPDNPVKSKVYVIDGDRVTLLKIAENLKYWRVRYTTKGGRNIEGWIDCNAINSCP
jgi:hypothetical protein